jgi:hypothetical protein
MGSSGPFLPLAGGGLPAKVAAKSCVQQGAARSHYFTCEALIQVKYWGIIVLQYYDTMISITTV